MDLPVELPDPMLAIAREVGLRAEDVEEAFIRGGGHGGQKINKTASCVQLKHLPTGILIRNQTGRAQHLNRLNAWKQLILKLEERAKGAESQLSREAFKVKKQKARRTRRAKEKMLGDKHHRGDIKESRQEVWRKLL